MKLLISLSENPTLTQHDTSQYEEHYHDDNQNHDDAIGLSLVVTPYIEILTNYCFMVLFFNDSDSSLLFYLYMF